MIHYRYQVVVQNYLIVAEGKEKAGMQNNYRNYKRSVYTKKVLRKIIGLEAELMKHDI
jgi:hypothetical protein